MRTPCVSLCRSWSLITALALLGGLPPAGVAGQPPAGPAGLPSAGLAGAVSPSFLVVPGRSAGRVALGMKLAAVERVLGAPTKVDSDPESRWITWRSVGLTSIAVEIVQNMVVLISIAHDSRYRTREGLGDGNSVGQLTRLLGNPPRQIRLPGYNLLQYPTRGIAFVVDETEHVSGIVVAPALRIPAQTRR